MAAIFNLNHPPHVGHWHFIYLSVPNIIVIAVMLVVFALAILLPFLAAVLLFLFGLSDLAIALLLLSGVIASTGWSVRKQQAQRRPPS